MNTPSANIKMRLPIPVGTTLGIGFAMLAGYIVTLVLVFIFQNQIETLTGINPAHSPLTLLMLILLAPWVIIAWLLIKKNTNYGFLNLYDRYLIITDEHNSLIKKYNAEDVAFVKLQHLAFHFTFKDGYRFNCINLAMEKGYPEQLASFNPFLREFIVQNQVPVQQGNIM
ncbi:hypothetical protein [Pedobacter sp.]|jgi:hypothetical protein|uniref:hypothetical protein n=1 Tax=Pedobacter sp. TaxID=1411316 RepID=UPI002CBA9032|nr:hypothetical protein [Pedobacter sp.]HWW38693.1 hypothetical protein [Pedobacter sp.]